MRRSPIFCFLLALALTVNALGVDAGAQEASLHVGDPPADDCSDCHNGEADDRQFGPPYQLLSASIHGDEDCDACHESIDMEDLDLEADNPHVEEIEPVDCGGCHEDEAEVTRAFEKGMAEIGHSGAMVPKSDCSVRSLDASLRVLAQAAPALKRRIVKACVACIAADGKVTPREGELAQAVAAVLDVPVPPVGAEREA